MTDLKPCTLCGAHPTWSDIYGARCPTSSCPQSDGGWWEESWNNWNTRPAQELPEGYREEGGTLYSRFGAVATWYPNGRIKASTNYKHAEALAIWLQRRAK